MVMTESPIQLVARMRIRVAWLSVTNSGDCIIKVLCPGDDPDFNSQVVNGNIAAVNLGKADRVRFRGENGARASFEAAVDHIDNLLLRVAMVVCEAFGVNNLGTQAAQPVLEAFGHGDAGNGGDLKTLKPVQRMPLAREDVLEVERLVRAFDDFGLLIELADGLAEFFGAVFTRFGDEDVIGALQIGDGLSQRAPGQEI